jgi:tetratricopeptide (TPR) repeat protein
MFHRLSTVTAATLLVAAVAGTVSSAKDERSFFYTPTIETAASLGVRRARKVVTEAAVHAFSKNADGGFVVAIEPVLDNKVLTLYYDGKKRRKLVFPLQDIDARLVNVKISRGMDLVGFETNAAAAVLYWRAPKTMDPELFITAGGLSPFRERKYPSYPDFAIRVVADSLRVLQSRASLLSGTEYARRFDEAVVRYRAAATKPALPEEARRFMVQAEAFVRNQDPDRASCVYVEALEIAPWWAEGHYNLGLYLAALDEFDGAIVEMKRYLALSPDAPDARAAQDKIYEWEVKVR